ncbi:MAG: PBECR2 nuclease fold domain-containing protein [Lachnospiraceae bacterium]
MCCIAINEIARSLGKLNLALLSECFEQIQTDEVIITQERLEHIKSRHPEDFDYFLMYGKESIESPDIILKDEKNTATVFMIKRLPETNLNVIVRVALDTDKDGLKNSVMTFYRLRNRNLEKMMKRHELLYKAE